MSGRGTNVGALVTHRTVVRQAALGETSDTIPERTPRVGSRALHNEPAAIDVRPMPTNVCVDWNRFGPGTNLGAPFT